MSTSDPPVTSEAKIAELLRAGQLSPEDARALKSALPGTERPQPHWRRLIDPWASTSERRQLGVALAVALASAAVSLLGGVRFDGALDLHKSGARVGVGTALLDQAASWLLTALVFWAVAHALKARPRLIDLVMVSGAARLPQLLAGVALAVVPLPPNPEQVLAMSPVLLMVLAVALLPLLGHFLVLLFTGWRHATGLRAPRVGIGFALGIVVAEVLSKVILSI